MPGRVRQRIQVTRKGLASLEATGQLSGINLPAAGPADIRIALLRDKRRDRAIIVPVSPAVRHRASQPGIWIVQPQTYCAAPPRE